MKKKEKKDFQLAWVVSSTENPLNYLESQYSKELVNVKFVSVLY
jgi:hypothetical protein